MNISYYSPPFWPNVAIKGIFCQVGNRIVKIIFLRIMESLGHCGSDYTRNVSADQEGDEEGSVDIKNPAMESFRRAEEAPKQRILPGAKQR